MPRNISFFYTPDQILDESKDVTRRKRWLFLKGGELLQGVRKGMGLKKGEKVERLRLIRVISARREMLCEITDEEVVREGFPDKDAPWFIRMWIQNNGGDERQRLTRIEFKYEEK